jgi:protein-L-isoaspartate(D-aspartate) O-methyltransferase
MKICRSKSKKGFCNNLFSLKIFDMRLWFSIFLVCAFVMGCSAQDDDKLNGQRVQMVERQIKARGITDKATIEACMKVPRHRFVLPHYINSAYADSPLPIDEGQTISQPYIVAFMTEALNLKRTDKVLEIGTGSGYQAAILGEICDSVFTIELFPKLGNKAIELFADLGYNNIFVKIGDGYKGWAEHAPFDAIIVTCSPTSIPKSLKDQLAEGGRMIIPVGQQYSQSLVLLEKRNGKLREEKVLPVRFVPMINEKGKEY